ncbi:protein FAR1-RELATED SEQUENCE 5-like [Ziziphus jujuba]|uniref:Protein FAR1-RELATED SEQUENCE 5-like n=1 Tax=Ziziphus jujuba TaxID=326968 RepID=A0ABM4A9A0_ZIZJJ|nr:protein FAR1-RELATED SEQUENCE 5-like [Ziziphus jujuba]
MTRENCKAKLAVVRSKTEKFVITVFVEEHSHPLSTPRRVHLLRSHRSVSEAKKSLTLQFSAANVPTHQQISILEFEAGGIENIGCTKKDIYNHEAKVQNQLRGQDAELLNEYFLTEQEKDPCFFFKIDVNDDGKLKCCFWADSVSRRAYGCFGDVVVFDTTYNTNQYGMIFAPLVGINNHGQTVLFACAFLSDEKTESFVWLFELLKDSMPTNNPKMIITDQDPAMTKAIVQSLPNTFHRYCSWHILEKFSTYLNVITYRDFYKDFQQCIWESESPEEFERKWVTTIEKASLDNNDWLKSIVELRKIESIVSNTKSGGISKKASTAHDYEALKNPSAVRAKGCGQRLKRGKEKATNAAKYRGRRCNGCGKIGQSHDKRNYPLLNNPSSQNEESPQHASEYDSKADSLSFTGQWLVGLVPNGEMRAGREWKQRRKGILAKVVPADASGNASCCEREGEILPKF